MNKIYLNLKSFIKNHKWLSIFIAIVILGVLGVIISKNSSSTQIETVTAKIQTVTEVVSSTGNVKPLSNVDLSFEKGGRVSYIPVSVGEKVYTGETLVSVGNADLVASVEQANAGLKIAQASLETLRKGATPEEIALSESQVEKAKNDLIQAKQGLINSIQDAYAKADDSIRNKIDVMFTNPRSVNTQLKFQTNDSQLKNNIEQGRITVENMLVSWNDSITLLNNSSLLDQAEKLADANLETTKNLLEKIALAVNNLNPDPEVTQANIDAWKISISTARANIGLVISGLSTGANQYQVSLSALLIAQNNLALTKAIATVEQIASAEASVEEAIANVNSANAQLAKSIIRSPINGVVTNINAKVGEVIQAGTIAISVISYGDYQVETFVPEADISKIKIGNFASTTLDAYGSEVNFGMTVIKIDPAATVIEGVPTYKVTLKFINRDERVRSGMTANLDIITAEKSNAVAVPARVVYTKDNGFKYVKILKGDGKTSEVEVKIGLRGQDGMVEIIFGVAENDKVATSL